MLPGCNINQQYSLEMSMARILALQIYIPCKWGALDIHSVPHSNTYMLIEESKERTNISIRFQEVQEDF